VTGRRAALQVVIDELVVEGAAAPDPERLVTAVEQRLGELVAGTASPCTRPLPDGSERALARSVADAVFGALPR
jgi:hypothetical protein